MNFNLREEMKKLLKHKNFQALLGWIISIYLRICFQSSSWITKNNNIPTNLLKKKKEYYYLFLA